MATFARVPKFSNSCMSSVRLLSNPSCTKNRIARPRYPSFFLSPTSSVFANVHAISSNFSFALLEGHWPAFKASIVASKSKSASINALSWSIILFPIRFSHSIKHASRVNLTVSFCKDRHLSYVLSRDDILLLSSTCNPQTATSTLVSRANLKMSDSSSTAFSFLAFAGKTKATTNGLLLASLLKNGNGKYVGATTCGSTNSFIWCVDTHCAELFLLLLSFTFFRITKSRSLESGLEAVPTVPKNVFFNFFENVQSVAYTKFASRTIWLCKPSCINKLSSFGSPTMVNHNCLLFFSDIFKGHLDHQSFPDCEL